MGDLITATIRTVVPAMVTYFTVYTSARGLELDSMTVTGIETGLIGLATGLFYLVVRVLAKKWPWVELLLGSKKTPEYKEGE